MFDKIKKVLFKSSYRKLNNVSILYATIYGTPDVPNLYDTPLYATIGWKNFMLKFILHITGYKTFAYPDICYCGNLKNNPPYITQQISNAIGGDIYPIMIIGNKYIGNVMKRGNTHFMCVAVKKRNLQVAYETYKKAVQQLPVIGETDAKEIIKIYALNLLTTGVGGGFPIKWYPWNFNTAYINADVIPKEYLDYLDKINADYTVV